MSRSLRKDLGLDSRSVFQEFDLVPLGAASIGQAHRAVLTPEYGGGEVVVKVQAPGIEQKFRADLKVPILASPLLLWRMQTREAQSRPCISLRPARRQGCDWGEGCDSQQQPQAFGPWQQGSVSSGVQELPGAAMEDLGTR